jgi:hypothetical protein
MKKVLGSRGDRGVILRLWGALGGVDVGVIGEAVFKGIFDLGLVEGLNGGGILGLR